MKSNNEPRLAMNTVKDAAAQLNLSERTVHRLIANGEIRTHRFCGAVRISQCDLDTYVAKSRK